ncbi:MAG: A24 family peptidase [Bryobacteraceae bacterium]|nr:A24 family peptidase [Bryobacteraceae bacterium]MDW8378554.1 A24 family peptidase [Bryobacterales bacterium]
MTGQLWIALLVGLVASAEDLWRRNISNWIPATACVVGFAWQVSQRGWIGVWQAFAGCAAGFAVFLAFYLLGGMGGGDIKLMAGFGALLGLDRIWEAALWTAILGALLAVAVLGFHAAVGFVRKEAKARQPKAIPYAPAIAAGVCLSLVPH